MPAKRMNEDDWRKAQNMRERRVSLEQIAEKFGVSREYIRRNTHRDPVPEVIDFAEIQTQRFAGIEVSVLAARYGCSAAHIYRNTQPPGLANLPPPQTDLEPSVIATELPGGCRTIVASADAAAEDLSTFVGNLETFAQMYRKERIQCPVP